MSENASLATLHPALVALDAKTRGSEDAEALLDPVTHLAYSVGTSRVCLGTEIMTALSASAAASLTVPTGAVTAEIQADGGTVRMRCDATAPTASRGWRIDDGASVTVDSVLADVRLLAQAGVATNVQITYFDRV